MPHRSLPGTPLTQTVCSGVAFTTINMNSSVGGSTFNWTRVNTANLIGMNPAGPGGTTTIPGALTNTTTVQQTETFNIVAAAGGCISAPFPVTVKVNPPPTVAAIAGPNKVCQASQITLTDATGGGTWSSDNNAIASITGGGVVTGGGTTGSALITYSK